MVVGTLKKGFKGALPVLIVFFILLFSISTLSTSNSKSDHSANIFYHLISSRFTHPLSILVINFLVLGIGALLITFYTIRQEVVDKTNYLPAFLYVFFGGLTLSNELIHPSLFANIFVLLTLIYLTDTYREDFVLAPIFNSAFFTSLALFFYINYGFFVILFFIMLINLRTFNWREWVIGLFGLFAPIFIYFCIGYLANYDYTNFSSNVVALFSYFQRPLISEYFYPIFFILVVLIILGLGKHLTKGLGTRIKTQKNIGIIYWFMVLSLVNFISKNNNHYFPIIASIIPMSILLSDYFYNIKQLKVANTLFFLLLASSSLLILMKLNLL